MSSRRAFAVRLTIPDNEARTAQATLAKLGVAIGKLERRDIWVFELAAGPAGNLAAAVASDETIFNPNKHRLEELAAVTPGPGEVWIASDLPARLAKPLPGVAAAQRLTGWRLSEADGGPASPVVLAAAVEALLCNAAYQSPIYQDSRSMPA